MLKAEAEAIVEDMEPGDVQFDDESGEGGTMTVDRERDLLLSAQAMEAVEEVDHALAKLDAGSYGICEHCGEMIGRERLRALPYARLCLRCKTPGLSRR
jgi:DnaK suppressor protein